jgi:drug/metabolite transporter (DMT)-like permease
LAIDKNFQQGLALALVGAIAFSAKAIVVKLAYRYSVSTEVLLMYRMLLSAPFFAAMAYFAGRGKPPLTRQEIFAVLGLGFSGYYLASYLDFLGLQYITASFERLILYLNPTIVLLLSVLLFKKPLRRMQLVGLAVSYLGIVFVFTRELGGENKNAVLGAALVFGSVVSYALYLTFSSEYVKRIGAIRLTGLATLVACLLCVAQFPLLRPVAEAAVPLPVVWLSVFNALFCTVLPVFCTMKAIEKIGAPLTSQMSMIGALSTIAMGVLLLDEPLNASIFIGAALVISGVYLAAKK